MMDAVLTNVEWTPIIVGAIVAFVLGAIWYAQPVFGRAWMAGSKIDPNAKGSMALPMIAQAFSTFLLSWLVGIAAAMNSLHLAILIAFTCAGLVKANGLFAGKSHKAVAIETGFVLVMVALMVLVHAIL